MAIPSGAELPFVHPFVGLDVTCLLEDRARRRGERPFLVWEPPDGQRRVWTYGEFERDVRAVAAGLCSRGVGVGDAVVVHLDNSPGFLLVWFACARIGAVAIDLNTRYAQDELGHAVELTGAVGMVTDPRLGLADCPTVTGLGWTAFLDPATGTVPELVGDPRLAPRRRPDPAASLCVQLTSGSTARPKGALYTHANALWAARVGAANWRLTPDTVQLVFAPLFHTLALCWQTLPTLWVGGAVVLQPKFSASRFWDVSVRNRCTHTSVLPLMARVLADRPVPEHSYRSWSAGGEMPGFEARYGIRIFSAWGQTEAVSTPVTGDLDQPAEEGAIGRPAPGYRVRVRRDDGVDAGPGETGDLLIKGVPGLSVFAGYLADPTATATAFDDGWLVTGDRMTILPSGTLKFAGRAKDMLKVSGENVAAAEIERVIGAVAGVRQAAVVARRDQVRGEVAVAFVTAEITDSEQTTLEDAIRAACQHYLADFKVPHAVYVVPELPRAALDKVAKGTLRQWAADRHAAGDHAARQGASR
ncbi:AMP-binding protein [Frankia sp. AgB1.9]|uniref:class I adenylate-forming enzyme family protein n=1 Tax=unclassified Frankia TaxID=2632575 RepID=UPI00193199C1|nr:MULTISPECIES: AMP-binding protein [unclassified Frankia]MBL7486585.1 AMP-binding protein [Frankia sp. AgW1.1]MBL7552167.1 AMP-binding protein [Frankia sp. AgB1.9]MBL7625136.1 AMP-binding protein [Frankia sp. AgB1.8]